MLIRSVLRSVLEDFSFVVRRVDEQRYGWVGLAAQLGGEGGADEVKSAIGGQVGITYDILDVVRQMGIFSAQDVQAVLLRKYHFSKETAEAMVEHFVRQLEGMLEVVGPSRWRYRGETSTTQEDSMAMLRSLASFKRH